MPQTLIVFVLRHKHNLGRHKIRILTLIGLTPGTFLCPDIEKSRHASITGHSLFEFVTSEY